MDALLDLIGAANGDRKEFDTWTQEARAAGLQPNMIQRLKRLGAVHTVIEGDKHYIVRGARPVPEG